MFTRWQKSWFAGGTVLLLATIFLAFTRRKEDVLLVAWSDCLQFLLIAGTLAAFLWNARRSRGQEALFWWLMSAGGVCWLVSQGAWVYFEVLHRTHMPEPFWGDIILFLHIVPMMGALAVTPDRKIDEHTKVHRNVDLALLSLWWMFIYMFVVYPWQYVVFEHDRFGSGFNYLYFIEQAALVWGLAMVYRRGEGYWRSMYWKLLAAGSVYVFSSFLINVALDIEATSRWAKYAYFTGSLYDIPLMLSQFYWCYVAFSFKPNTAEQSLLPMRENRWFARLGMAAVVTLPLLALWVLYAPSPSANVDRFRMQVACMALVLLTGLVFVKQRLLHRELERSLKVSRQAYEDLKNVQGQLVQTEKLASLGRLVAGAAHEINNPLTAIMGYADLLAENPRMETGEKGMAEKIRQQARRTKTLVNNLLSFAKQGNKQSVLMDLNGIVVRALELRELDFEQKHIEIIRELAAELPRVTGDPNLMLQVCFHIFNNAVDAMQEAHGGGTMLISTSSAGETVVLRCSDTGPGIANLDKVFEPFYTTKEIGKGTGLGLSACYGIVREHGGNIRCFNRPEGGATFEITLPVNAPMAVAGRQAIETTL